MTQHEFGKRALKILKYKVERNSGVFKPEEFSERAGSIAKDIHCSKEDLLAFYQKYLLPEVLIGCNFKGERCLSEPTELEAFIASDLLERFYFCNSANLKDEVDRISEKTGIVLEEVIAIALYVLGIHIYQQFGSASKTKLVITAVPIVGA
ncbi:MAG: hypothetical protein WCT19_01435 [Candidatus Paceibacterota bacterium]